MDTDIRERAYMLWQADGCPEGDGATYWRRAEDEVVTEAETDTWSESLRATPKPHVRHDRFRLRNRI